MIAAAEREGGEPVSGPAAHRTTTALTTTRQAATKPGRTRFDVQ
jgi:hypothetical protein